MNISPVIFTKVCNNNNFSNKNIFNNSLKNDIFVRTTSFGKKESKDDKSFEEFEKWAEETNFIDNALKMINETAPILGSGFEGTTYAIPGCDKWVMKEYKRASLLPEGLKRPRITKITDVSPKLNIGQFIASVKIPVGPSYSQQFYILKRQNGKSFGVPYSDRDTVSDFNVQKHKESLKELASFPIETYKKLLDDIEYVNNQGCELDCVNPYNFMVDSDKQTINFVDANDRRREKGIQYGDVLFALLDGDFAHSFNASNRPQSEKDEASKYSREICSKFLSSRIRKQAKFTPSEKFDKVYNSEIFNQAIGETDPDKKEDLMITLGLY
jgi:hypothetical protein